MSYTKTAQKFLNMVKVLFSYLLLLLMGMSFEVMGQELIPPIQNHSSVEYNAASQNWDIALDDAGIVYAANNRGLLSYDGQQWELFPLQTGSIIRSVYPHKDRVYTGSYREFGYWSRDETGKMFYTSLMPLLGDYNMQSEEFWEILSYGEAIYFRSFGAVYKYENDVIQPVKNVITNKMLIYRDKLLLAINKQGVFFLEENGDLKPLPNQEVIQGNTVVDMAVDGDNLLMGTKDALYFFDGETCRLYDDPVLNRKLNSFELNHIMTLPNNELVLATVKNGVLHYNPNTGEIRNYNRNNGLQNNTVLRMAKKNGKIWLGLDNGIDELQLDSPIEFFRDDTGELGAVYDIEFYKDVMYLASNTGVYRLDDEGLALVEGAEGHCWNLEVIDNILFSNHNTGTYKVEEDKFVPVDSRTGSFVVLKSPRDPNKVFIGNYTGISTYDLRERTVNEIKDVNFPVKKIIFENEFVLWAAHPYEGVYRIGFDAEKEEATYVHKIKGLDGESGYKSDVFRLNNHITILKNQKWYRYNSFKDSLDSFPELKAYKDFKLLLEDSNGFWFTNTRLNSLRFTDFRNMQVNVSFKELQNRVVKDHENLLKVNDSIYYFNLNDGFARINLSSLVKAKQEEFLSRPIIKGMLDSRKRNNLLRSPKIPFKDSRNITFLAALPDSDASSLNYELIGENNQKGLVKNGVLRFQNLSHGDYKLNLFALSPQEVSSELTSFDFSIKPPWYLSNLMKVAYFLIFLSLVGFVHWFNRLKLNKHQWLLEQKFEKEHQERLNNLEKERLRGEITAKRKELANTTMIAAKKNEVLMEIQEELKKDRKKFSNQFRLKHIMNKINQAIKDKDEWKVFETNFNELHEDFFKDLLEKYPKLSNKDLKLCSYLKMNLSSKEIAPLMGISVRGVEVHRYRLRKKMKLDKKENLTNFLIKNF